MVAITVGPSSVGLSRIGRWLLGNDPDGEFIKTILFKIRLPRAYAAILTGGGLAVAGFAFQVLLRNPLASSYTLGISGGAAAGALCSYLLHVSGYFTTPLFAFAGALATVVLVAFLGGMFLRLNIYTLILSGIIVNAFFSALLTLVLVVINPFEMQMFFHWLMGNLGMATVTQCLAVTPVVLLGVGVLLYFSWDLFAVGLSENLARGVGVEVGKLQWTVFLAGSAITACVVSIAGTVGFIGIAVPHLCRLIYGREARDLILPVFALGAAFALASDTLARTVLPGRELPIGVVTAFIGAPVFVYLLRRAK
jgi:iron complex transport system permease protein